MLFSTVNNFGQRSGSFSMLVEAVVGESLPTTGSLHAKAASAKKLYF